MASVAKFRVESVKAVPGSDTASQVMLRAQYDDTLPEDRRFALRTPAATLEMMVDNPPVIQEIVENPVFFAILMTEAEYREFEAAR